MKIVVVGSGPGGLSAAWAAKSFNRDAEVIIISKDTGEAHKKPGSAMALEYPETETLNIPDWSNASLEKMGIKVRSGIKVIDADASSKTLEIESSESDIDSVSYEKLIIATGGKAYVPEIPGTDLEGVFTIQNVSDSTEIGKQMENYQDIVVVGAGFSGLEIAEKLLELDKKVHLIVRSRLMRRLLEKRMSDELESRLPRSLEVHKGKSPSAVLGDERVTGLAINDTEIKTDAVIFMTGVNPKVKLARKLGLEIGSLGGIVVDSKMRTSDEDIFAVGDCIEMADFYTGKPVMMPIGSVAARCGRQAGVVAVGGQKVYEDTDLRFQYDRIFNTDIVCVGYSSEIASRVGVEVDVRFVTHPAEQMEIAVVTAKDGQVLGGQVISSRLGAKMGYQILQRMQEGTTLEDNPLLDPLHDRILASMEHRYGAIG
ncbi:hypothetical protein EU537_11375 [Candidatus Thorarchaeota archaeon]|nr:MAG: hypothetical protein EU537_11375 [Candidatus Thorarchaeota archaeon]